MSNSQPTRWERRDRRFNLYYYISLSVLGVVVVWHWIFGGNFGLFGKVTAYAVYAIILIGFLNATIGIFGRESRTMRRGIAFDWFLFSFVSLLLAAVAAFEWFANGKISAPGPGDRCGDIPGPQQRGPGAPGD